MSFLGSSAIKMLKHFVEFMLVKDKPIVTIIHVACKDITWQLINIVDPSNLADGIINIDIICAKYGIKDIIFVISIS